MIYKYFKIIIAAVICLTAMPIATVHAADKEVMINELQTGGIATIDGVTAANQEFIELKNTTSLPVTITDWKLQYRASSWSNKNVDDSPSFSGVIPANGFYLLSSKSYLPQADGHFSSGLAGGGGAIRFLDNTGIVIDALSWGTGSCDFGNSATAPAGGESLERSQATADSRADFTIQTDPSPKAVADSPKPDTEDEPTIDSDTTENEKTVISLAITELLIDPTGTNADGSAASDATDEFIEIHNTGTSAVDLAGFVLNTTSDQYIFPNNIINADEYLVLRSVVTKLALSNSGGQLELLYSDGVTQLDTTEWGKATAGAVWAIGGGEWQWSSLATPGAANIILEPAEEIIETDTTSNSSSNTNTVYPALEITEILPDPASPQTDATDEFIEIYNPNSFTVSLGGYQIRVGKTLSSVYTLPDSTLGANAYIAFKSSQTHLVLSNSGSSVALFDPLGVQVGSTITYPTAKVGAGYIKLNGTWQWSSEATPAAANIAKAVSAVNKSVVVKATKTAKPKISKTPKPKAAKTAVVKAYSTGTSDKPVGPGLRWLIVTLAGLTATYIIYEFRHDILSFYHRRIRPIKVDKS